MIPSRALHHPADQLAPLRIILEMCCGKAELLWHKQMPWWSATFSGHRHVIALRFAGEEAVAIGEAFIKALPGAEFVIAGQFVASTSIGSVIRIAGPDWPETSLECELLVLEDA